MYTIKEITYSEAGSILAGKNFIGFMVSSDRAPFTERILNISNITVDSSNICFDIIRWSNPGIRTYADAKKFIISKRYSNDDQIAIILNKDNSEEDALAFQKMQEWRDWASILAKKIMECIEKSKID